jgi:Na+/H+-dicarboxylate symporter
MPIIAVSSAITQQFVGSADVSSRSIVLSAAEHAEIFVPDRYASTAFLCETTEPTYRGVLDNHGRVWFRGIVSGAVKSLSASGELSGEAALTGSVYRCNGEQTVLAASGVKVLLPLAAVGENEIRVRFSRAWVAYPAAVADMFIAFLLMVFIPTLTLSIMKAVLDSAQSDRGAATLFGYSFRYFTATTLLAGAVGLGAGYVTYLLQRDGANLSEIASVSAGEASISTDYDPHPILNQLIGIVPTNPLSALSNPDGNKALQVAFLAVLIGLLLSLVDEEHRRRASTSLKNSLALVVKDADLKWRALSDWADLLTPAGVFFISIKFGATVSHQFLKEMLVMILAILAALALHCALLVAWIVARRDWRDWFRSGLWPGVPGLMTALATSSSYAALPGITSVPLLARDSSRRGVFDFCTMANKNGTTIYISAMAAYVLFHQSHGTFNSLAVVVLLMSGLASIATAGLPFAAVFGLRMVLLASNAPGAIAWAILPIDPLVDRFVTVLNVFANLAACSRRKAVLSECPKVDKVAA